MITAIFNSCGVVYLWRREKDELKERSAYQMVIESIWEVRVIFIFIAVIGNITIECNID